MGKPTRWSSWDSGFHSMAQPATGDLPTVSRLTRIRVSRQCAARRSSRYFPYVIPNSSHIVFAYFFEIFFSRKN